VKDEHTKAVWFLAHKKAGTLSPEHFEKRSGGLNESRTKAEREGNGADAGPVVEDRGHDSGRRPGKKH
jgi:hypothetical protein